MAAKYDHYELGLGDKGINNGLNTNDYRLQLFGRVNTEERYLVVGCN